MLSEVERLALPMMENVVCSSMAASMAAVVCYYGRRMQGSGAEERAETVHHDGVKKDFGGPLRQ